MMTQTLSCLSFRLHIKTIMSSNSERIVSSPSTPTTAVPSSPVNSIETKCPFMRSREASTSSSSYYSIEQDPNNPHCFRHPTEKDVRGPCPALNTLANHGYLPRDGRNITPKDLLKALQHPDTYNCSAPLARVLVWGGFLLLCQNRKMPKSISLFDIALHGRIEHNASVVHRNTPQGEKYAPIDVDLRLLEHFLEVDFMTIENIAQRRVELEVASPLDGLHSEIARGEWSLVLGIFGKANQGKIHPDILNVFLQDNRFVTGWKPSHRQSLLQTVATSFRIRRRMNKFRSAYLALSNEKRKDRHIKEALEGESEKS